MLHMKARFIFGGGGGFSGALVLIGYRSALQHVAKSSESTSFFYKLTQLSTSLKLFLIRWGASSSSSCLHAPLQTLGTASSPLQSLSPNQVGITTF